MLALVMASCSQTPLPPQGQVLLYVDTDAIVPLEQGAEDPLGQAALFDRLRIEIYPPGAVDPCDDCTREFGVDRSMFRNLRCSLGILPPPNVSGYRAKVQLYRTAGTDFIEPRPSSTLEAVVALPVVASDGVVPAHVMLETATLGKPMGTLDSPVPAIAGVPPGSAVDSFAMEQRRLCGSEPADDEVCVPGGAYWMGDPNFDIPSEILVAVSPFFLTRSEITVPMFRESGLGTINNVVAHGTGSGEHCTYTREPDAFESYPVNCVTRAACVQYCEQLGGRLPSEAQLEFVMRARRGAASPWGNSEPRCEDAVFARDGQTTVPEPMRACVHLGTGVQPVGSGARDRLALVDGELVDLAGNLTEWVDDTWQKGDEACWVGNLLTDPVCTLDSIEDPGNLALRGANWSDPSVMLLGAIRSKIAGAQNKASVRIGFRCARPG